VIDACKQRVRLHGEQLGNGSREMKSQQTTNRKSVGLSNNILHEDVIIVFNTGATRLRKNYYKFRWDQVLDRFKTASVESNRMWKAACGQAKWTNFLQMTIVSTVIP
jgi:hypothetical protein